MTRVRLSARFVAQPLSRELQNQRVDRQGGTGGGVDLLHRCVRRAARSALHGLDHGECLAGLGP